MSADRKAALIAGLLYMLGMVAGMLSVAPSVDGQDYMVQAAAHQTQVTCAAFFQLLMVPAYVGIAIVLYPPLKKHGEALALGFVGFRLVAGAFLLIGVVVLLLVLAVSRDFVNGGVPEVSYLPLGALLRTGRDLVNHVAMILASSFGALAFYSLLYRAKLVPRWLSGWGLIGAAFTIVASLFVMFRLFDVLTTTYLALNVPMAVQELVFAIWLVAKGFDPSATGAASH